MHRSLATFLPLLLVVVAIETRIIDLVDEEGKNLYTQYIQKPGVVFARFVVRFRA